MTRRAERRAPKRRAVEEPPPELPRCVRCGDVASEPCRCVRNAARHVDRTHGQLA